MTDYDPNGLHEPSSESVSPVASIATSDLDRYRPYVAHLDMPEARKTDMLLAIRRIMQNFVDRVFGDDPVQRCLGLEDKHHEKDEYAALPVIGLDSGEAGKKLSDSFHQHVIEENREEKR